MRTTERLIYFIHHIVKKKQKKTYSYMYQSFTSLAYSVYQMFLLMFVDGNNEKLNCCNIEKQENTSVRSVFLKLNGNSIYAVSCDFPQPHIQNAIAIGDDQTREINFHLIYYFSNVENNNYQTYPKMCLGILYGPDFFAYQALFNLEEIPIPLFD